MISSISGNHSLDDLDGNLGLKDSLAHEASLLIRSESVYYPLSVAKEINLINLSGHNRRNQSLCFKKIVPISVPRAQK